MFCTSARRALARFSKKREDFVETGYVYFSVIIFYVIYISYSLVTLETLYDNSG